MVNYLTSLSDPVSNDGFCNIPSSLLLTVLQERHIWPEDAGCSWGRVGVRSAWSEARYVALQLHSVHELHREVAHVKKKKHYNIFSFCT